MKLSPQTPFTLAVHVGCSRSLTFKLYSQVLTLNDRLKYGVPFFSNQPTQVQAVVVVLGVVGLRRVDDEQAGSPERPLQIDLKLYDQIAHLDPLKMQKS